MKKGLVTILLVVFASSILIMPMTRILGFDFDPGLPPSDTTNPTVEITSHDYGDIISGAFTVTATANDNVGVTQVTFALHDISLGSDTSTPYAKTYNILNNNFDLRDGFYLLKAIAYDAAGNYDVDQVYVEVVNGRELMAVIVGISDYKVISDLHYCDEDATDWYNFFTTSALDFDDITVLGDGHEDDYPQYDGIASEYNIKNALITMVSNADENDVIVFATSGHGGGNGVGSSYINAWDSNSGENGENGNFYDTELQLILEDAIAARIFVFIDHCYSGGFGPELLAMTNSDNVYAVTTCTEDGYGYDSSTYDNGLWTYYFLEYSWIDHYGGSPYYSLETIFDYSHDNYPKSGGDEPQEFDGSAIGFKLV